MKEERFWRLIALTALALLAVSVFRAGAPASSPSSGFFVSPAHAKVTLDQNYAFTASEDGSKVYVWDLTSRGPQIKWTAEAH